MVEFEPLLPAKVKRVLVDDRQDVVVQSVPDVGSVRVLDPVATKVIGNAPTVVNASAKETFPPPKDNDLVPKERVPLPVDITLPLIVAVLSKEVLSLLALIVKAVTFPLVPDTWNLAEVVEVPPITKSFVILNGESTPFANCQ